MKQTLRQRIRAVICGKEHPMPVAEIMNLCESEYAATHFLLKKMMEVHEIDRVPSVGKAGGFGYYSLDKTSSK
jgi:hypothetical protein